MITSQDQLELIKEKGNDAFKAGKFSEAEILYSECLQSEDNTFRVVILTNRAAARLSLNKINEALLDAEEALALDPKYLKAYYRKASALEKLGKLRESYLTWIEATNKCEMNPTLKSSLQAAEKKWVSVFRDIDQPIESSTDLIQRHRLLKDKRERLSTLAHFWNDSDQDQRYVYFHTMLKIIGGAGELSEANQELISPSVMVPLPMDNYKDMTKARMPDWFDYFLTLQTNQRTELFETIWNVNLSSEEKNDVIKDLKNLLHGFTPYTEVEEDV